MNYTCDVCTIYRIPKIQEKLNTLYPNFDQKIPYTKWLGIPYTQNPWPGLKFREKEKFVVACLRHQPKLSIILSRLHAENVETVARLLS